MKGEYTTKTGYDWIISQRLPTLADSLDLGLSWRWIWRLKVPLKCILLVWLAAHGSLPTNEYRFKRGIANFATSVICNEEDESVLHCLCDCRMAKDICLRVGYHLSNPLFQSQDPLVWLRREVLGGSNPLAMASVWWIWRARCNFCLENTMLNPFIVAANITDMANDIQLGFGISNAGTPSQPMLVRWCPRNPDRLVINVDESVHDNTSRDGFGGCLRSGIGQWFAFLASKMILIFCTLSC